MVPACAVILLAFGCGGNTSTSKVQSWSAGTVRATTDLTAATKNGDTPGAIVEVTAPGFIWSKGFGFGDVLLQKPMDPTMEFRIGSITKTFIAMLAMHLVEKGKILGLDDPIGNYIHSYVPSAWSSVTVRMLATMSSGIPDFIDNATYQQFLNANPYHVFTPQELLAYVKTEAPLYTPGTKSSYSNTNGLLLGLICDAVGGDVEAQLQSDFFNGLGLAGTKEPTDNSMPTNSAHGYSQDGDGTFFSPSHFIYAADMISNAADLTAWIRAVGNGTAPGVLASQLFVNPANPGGAQVYGFGIEIAANGWFGHLGEIKGGYQTAAFYNPKLDATIVVLANTQDNLPSGKGVSNAIFETVSDDIFGKAFSPGYSPLSAG
jgi:D-alanyl-D-alanine carboxypeptidase